MSGAYVLFLMSSPEQEKSEIILRGIPGAGGVSHGPALVFVESELDIPAYTLDDGKSEEEIERFETALLETRKQISHVRQEISKKLGEAEAQIFDAHQLVLEDKALIDEVINEQQKTNYNIEYCFHRVAQRYIDFFDTIDDDYLKERVTDIRDVARRLLQVLLGQKERRFENLSENRIVVSEDLTPSDTALLHKERMLGFLTESGGATSHSVIMARSLEIPAVVGVHGATEEIQSGDDVLIDGYDGLVYINPTEETLYRYGKIERRIRSLQELYRTSIGQESKTLDGQHVILRANIDSVRDLEAMNRVEACGVGLFRTENLFLRENDFPDEEQQYQEYREVVEGAAPHAVVIRTLDLGGDKNLRGMFEQDENNPFMGFRAIRFCLQHPEIFKDQLRAILRASAHGKVRVLYPMISGLRELEEANAFLEKAKADLREREIAFDESIEVGSMIEIPSAVYLADALAKHCQFFSIGTNDLIQYMLAADRMNDRIAHLYTGSHPSVLRAIQSVIKSGIKNNIPVSICGEMASEPRYALLLLGMGAHELSLSLPSFPEINYLIRRLDGGAASDLAEKALLMDDPGEISQFIGSFHQNLIADIEAD